MCYIRSNLRKNVFATFQYAFLSRTSRFITFLLGHVQKSEKVPYEFSLFGFLVIFIFAFTFSSFLIFLLQL